MQTMRRMSVHNETQVPPIACYETKTGTDRTENDAFRRISIEFEEQKSLADYLNTGDAANVVSFIDSQEKTHYENDIKVLIDTILRETLLKLSCEIEINFKQLEWLLQLSFTLAKKGNCSCSLPTVILSELFDCRTLQECELLFSFIDNNVKVWKEEIFFKNVKNMLLRICNDLLRRLSRNQNTVFCGRILIFLANFFPLFERSGLNITSEFNQDNSTSYALQADGELSDNAHVIEPSKADDAKLDINFKIDYNFYKKFWQLQEFFRNPIVCYTKSNYKSFQVYCNEVLSVFAGYKIDPNSCFYFQTLAQDSTGSDRNIFFVKYLTNQKLLELQLSDSNFRRHILIQILVIFQYFTTNVKSRNDIYVLSEEQTNWINETRKKVNQLIEETPPNGGEVRQVIEHLLMREEYWNRWKNDGCNELREAIEADEDAQQNAAFIRGTYQAQQLRARVGDKVRAHSNSNRILIGNQEMTRLWNVCPDNLEACKSAKRVFTPTIERYFESVLKRPAEQRLVHCSEPNFSWKALRLLSQKSNFFFVPSNQVVKPVNDYLQGVTERLAEEWNVTTAVAPSSGNNNSGGTPIDEDDTGKADTEDISDDELLKNVYTNSVKSADDDPLDTPDTNDSNTNDSALPGDILAVNIIEQISLKIVDHWDELSPLFGFAEDELEYIKENFPDPLARIKHLVTLWKDEQGPEAATLKNLQKIVHSVKPDLNLY